MSILGDPEICAEAAALRARTRPRPAARVQARLDELAALGLDIGLHERLAAEAFAEELSSQGLLDDAAALEGGLKAILCRKPADYAAFEGRSATEAFETGWREVGRAEDIARRAAEQARSGRGSWRRVVVWLAILALVIGGAAAALYFGPTLITEQTQTTQQGVTGGQIDPPPGVPPVRKTSAPSVAPAPPVADEGAVAAILRVARPFGYAPTLEELAGALPTPDGATPITFARALHELSGAPLGRPVDLTAPEGWLPRLAPALDVIAGQPPQSAAAYANAAQAGIDALPPLDRDPARQRAIDAPQRVHEIENAPWIAASAARPVSLALKASVALAPLGLVLLWLAAQVSRRAFLRRRKPVFPPEETEFVAGVRRKEQPGWSARDKRFAQLLQAREAVETRRLDLAATVEATARAGLRSGAVIRYQTLRPAPEYLVLIQADGARDLEAERMRALVDWLELQKIVNLDIYRFQFSVAWLQPEAGGPAEPIETVQARFPNHRLIILGRGDGLVDAAAGAPRPAASTLLAWPRRALLTPVRIGDWGAREQALARALAMPIGRATRDGALLLGDMLGLEGPETSPAEREHLADAADGRLGPLPELLRLTPERVLYRRQPRDLEREQLVAGLREALDGVGLDWLAALAVYPELRWDLTLYLGVTLGHYADTPAGDRRLAMLTRLPWLRAGTMPDWVRETLIETLSPAKRGAVYEVIDAILAGAERPENRDDAAVRLKIAEEPGRSATPPPELVDREIGEDRVLLDFLRRGDKGDYPVRARRRGGITAALREGRVWRALAVAGGLGVMAWAVTPAAGAVAATGAWLPTAALYGGALALVAAILFLRWLAAAWPHRSGAKMAPEPGSPKQPRADAKPAGDGPGSATQSPRRPEPESTRSEFRSEERAREDQDARGAETDAAATPPDPRMRAPGTIFRDRLRTGGEGPDMVVIPAGEFLMGSREGEGPDHERPRHKVTIKTPFALGKYAVTFAEYDAYCAATGATKPSDEDWGRERRPVINVSWEDAQDYCRWLSEQTGATYRLPSEAEWEYACRAGTTTRYSFGDVASQLGDYAWFGENAGSQTHPVGEKRPNAFGLHDMHGNVWEWVQDCWNASYSGAPDDGSAWMSGDCSRAVLRGGSWSYNSIRLRSAYRSGGRRDGGYFSNGFRISRTLLE